MILKYLYSVSIRLETWYINVVEGSAPKKAWSRQSESLNLAPILIAEKPPSQ
jgi:hypothetical protein